MSILRSLFGPSKEEIWSQLCAEIGGTMVGGGWSGGKAQAQYDDWIVTLDTYTVSTGKSSVTYTRIRAPFVNQDQFQFTVYRAGFFTHLGKFFGLQDIEIGEPVFDEQFVLQGANDAKVRALFANSRIRELLLAQPAVYLSIRDDEGWFHAQYPAGVDVLYFQVTGVIKDVEVLKGLFALYSEVLHYLSHLDSAYQDDVSLHLRALRAPGGQLLSENVLLWDGDPPRHAAILALGQLKAQAAVPALLETLVAANPQLRVAALWALGEIGDPQAAPAIVPLLGDGTPAGDHTVRQATAEALQRLGQGELAEAFLAAIDGHREAVGTLRRLSSPGVLQALSGVVAGMNSRQAAHAAWTLGQLGEVRALPAIRKRAKELRSAPPEELRLFAEAIEQLEVHSALPRPASSPGPDVSSLPRPADEA